MVGFLSFGIIPAYAGSTRNRARDDQRPRDHPRIRGEHHAVGGRGEAAPRIIPAYAGSTWVPSTYPALAADHPRIRGEHRVMGDDSGVGRGSSPHTRGAPDRGQAGQSGDGIIPAYAGSTPSAPSGPHSPKDHPCIRGEHGVLAVDVDGRSGSSPHTRGARPRTVRSGALLGIIPAYAGSTFVSRSLHILMQDHPRIRGEHSTPPPYCWRVRGSSPHTRGARLSLNGEVPGARIIPAYAGSTPSPIGGFIGSGDHPRIRGEHMPYFSIGSRSPGSSPHTRGARLYGQALQVLGGIIPAYAGSTPWTFKTA